MTLVEFLHSGDPDVIPTRGLQVPNYSGVSDLQVPDYRYSGMKAWSGVNDLHSSDDRSNVKDN